MKSITTHQLRLLSWSRRKSVHGTICWSALFLLSIGFNTILLLDEYWGGGKDINTSFLDFIKEGQPKWLPAFGVILKDSLLLTLSLMLMVSFNLSVLKKGILDRKIFPWWRDGLYLLTVIISAIVFTWVLEVIEGKWNLIRVSMPFPYKAMVYFVFSLISSGVVYVRELYDQRRELLKSLSRQLGFQKELQELFGEMEGLQQEVEHLQGKLQETRVAKDHIKVGSKEDWEIVQFEDILYIQGDGNKAKIFVKNKGFFNSNMRMVDFEEELPTSLFIRVNKSYIINKYKVLKRRNGYFHLKDCDKHISIGDTYKELIDSDPHLGFHKG